MSGDYRIVQDGVPVAWSQGPRAHQEIMHYALVYSEDAPVTVQERHGRRWRTVVNVLPTERPHD
jgi:hypothetical protein